MSDDARGAQPAADAVADALGRVPSVRLHQGSAAGTHLPGRRVHGVRVHDAGVEVHVAAVWPTTVEEAAQAVRAALAPLVTGRVDVTIDDVVLDDDPRSEGLGPEGTATEVSHA
ncbi:hypothetical protein [Actinotalea sp. Marseille-Q4924]|uniref:hypothetical protein n=1 Tax=Actinotalea sp. Marseille-Q4924 TaxID=2866571 RepID=UPI001CE3D412|nr:hypothetical protein [Actinotalea sp. Marseille-Q4924]